MLKTVDDIFSDLAEYVTGYELKYNKFYIGISKDGVAKNFISFKPKKSFLYLIFKANEDKQLSEKLEDAGLDITYESRWKQYRIKLADYEDYKKHRDIIVECVSIARDYFNLSDI